jgi:hypothetical protein
LRNSAAMATSRAVIAMSHLVFFPKDGECMSPENVSRLRDNDMHKQGSKAHRMTLDACDVLEAPENPDQAMARSTSANS